MWIAHDFLKLSSQLARSCLIIYNITIHNPLASMNDDPIVSIIMIICQGSMLVFVDILVIFYSISIL